jgi:acyl dehydratase
MALEYFEDYMPGSVYEYGSVQITEPELLEFAHKFDPQPIHTDPHHAALGPFVGLIASGLHTISAVMSLFVRHYLTHVASLASPGVDEVRFPIPVRPGDVLRARVETLDSRLSNSKPDRGIVRSRIEGLNQNGEIVLSLIAINIIGRRPVSTTPAG